MARPKDIPVIELMMALPTGKADMGIELIRVGFLVRINLTLKPNNLSEMLFNITNITLNIFFIFSSCLFLRGVLLPGALNHTS